MESDEDELQFAAAAPYGTYIFVLSIKANK
jgi:hypothetical protein